LMLLLLYEITLQEFGAMIYDLWGRFIWLCYCG
jgi:hypothetical protein